MHTLPNSLRGLMRPRHQIIWTLFCCWAWLLCKSGLTTAIPVTRGQTTQTKPYPIDPLFWGTEGDYFDATTLMTTETITTTDHAGSTFPPSATPSEELTSTLLGPTVGTQESPTDSSKIPEVLPTAWEESDNSTSTFSPSVTDGEDPSVKGTVETSTYSGLTPTVDPWEELSSTISGPSTGIQKSFTDSSTIPGNIGDPAKEELPAELPPSSAASPGDYFPMPFALSPRRPIAGSPSGTPEGGSVSTGLEGGPASPLSSDTEPGTPGQDPSSPSKANSTSLGDALSGSTVSEGEGRQPSSEPPGSLLPPINGEGNNLSNDTASSLGNRPSPPLDSTLPGDQSQAPAGSPGPNQLPPVAALRPGSSAFAQANELEGASGVAGKETASDASATESQSAIPSPNLEGTGSADSKGTQTSPDDVASAGTGASEGAEGSEGSSGTRGKEVPFGSSGAESQAPGAAADEASRGDGAGSAPLAKGNTSLDQADSEGSQTSLDNAASAGTGASMGPEDQADSEGSQTSPDDASATGSRPTQGSAGSEGSLGASANVPLGNSVPEPQSPGTSTGETSGDPGKGSSPLSNEGEEITDSGTIENLQPSVEDTAAAEPAASTQAEESDGSSSICGKNTYLGSTAEESPESSANGKISEGFGNGRACHFGLAAESAGGSGPAGEQQSQPSVENEPEAGSGASEGEQESGIASSLNGKETPLGSSAAEPQTSASEEVSETPGKEGSPQLPGENAGSTGSEDSEEAEDKEVSQKEKPSDNGNGDGPDSNGNQGSQLDNAPAAGSSGGSGKGTPSGPLAEESQSPGTSTGETSGVPDNGKSSSSSGGVENSGPEKADSEVPQASPDGASGGGSRASGAPEESGGTSEANGAPLANSDAELQSPGTSTGGTSGDLGNGGAPNSPDGGANSGPEKAGSEGPQASSADALGFRSAGSTAPEDSNAANANGSPLANSNSEMQYSGTSTGETSGGLTNGGASNSLNGVENSGLEKAGSEGPQASSADALGFRSAGSTALEDSNAANANGAPLANSDAELQSPGTSTGGTSGDFGNGGAPNSPDGGANSGPEKAGSEGPQASSADALGFRSAGSTAPEDSNAANANGNPLANSNTEMQHPGTSTGETSGGLTNGGASNSLNGVENSGLEKGGNEVSQTSPVDASGSRSAGSTAPEESEGTNAANGVPLANSDTELQSPGTSTGETSGVLTNGGSSNSLDGMANSVPEKAGSEGPQASSAGALGFRSAGSMAPEESEGTNAANGVPLAYSDTEMQYPGTSTGETSGGLTNGGASNSLNGEANSGPEKGGSEGPQTSPAYGSVFKSGASMAPEESEGTNVAYANGVPLANSESELQSPGTSTGEISEGLTNGEAPNSLDGGPNSGPEKAGSEGSQALPADVSEFRSRASLAPEESEGANAANVNGVPLANSDSELQSPGTSTGDLGNGGSSNAPDGVANSGPEKAGSEGSQASPADALGFRSGASMAPEVSQGSNAANANDVPLANSDAEMQSSGTSTGETSGGLTNGGASNSPDRVANIGPDKTDNDIPQASPVDALGFRSAASMAPEESQGTNAANANGVPLANSDAELQSPGTSTGESSGGITNGGASNSLNGVANSGPETMDNEGSQASPADASGFRSAVSLAPEESEGSSAANANGVPLANSDAEMQSSGTSTGETSEGLGKGKSGVKGKGGKSPTVKGAGGTGAAEQKSSLSNLVPSGSKKTKPGSTPDSPSQSRSSSANKPVSEGGKGRERESQLGKLGPRPASSSNGPPARESPTTSNRHSDKKSKNSKSENPATVNTENVGRARNAHGHAPSASSLLPYGAAAKDTEYVERKADFNSPVFKPAIGIPLGKTLYDGLCYTDNGQIMFLASDKGVSSSPDPPPRGFNGREKQPMIAVFWQNADFSRGTGTTFYQEYVTQKSATHPVVSEVERMIHQYTETSYSARWTLKVTWERVQPYPAQKWVKGTNTYQAIITTNGYTTYALFLYQRDGMQWDYTKLASTNVLIGYTSGDGYFRNDDLIDRTPAEKYRPDRWEGYNTDVRGLWIYQLNSRVRMNYRQMCLDWVNHEGEPLVWNHGLPSCPCTLEQAESDKRFTRSKAGSSRRICCVPWLPESETHKTSVQGVPGSSITMFSSSAPNQHGAGVRCLYGAGNKFLEGRQERIWRDARKPGSNHDEELKFYHWCCNQAGNPHICDKYGQKRPKIGCDGHRPSVWVAARREMEQAAAAPQETSNSESEEQWE